MRHAQPVRLETAPTGLDKSESRGELELMRHAQPVRLETAPTGLDKSKSRGESVYLFEGCS